MDPVPDILNWAEPEATIELTCTQPFFRPSVNISFCTYNDGFNDSAIPGAVCVPGCVLPPNPHNGTFNVTPAPGLHPDWADLHSITQLLCNDHHRPFPADAANCTATGYDAPINTSSCVPGSHSSPTLLIRQSEGKMAGCAVPTNPDNGTFAVTPTPSEAPDWADVDSTTLLTCAANYRPSSPSAALCTLADYNDSAIHTAYCQPGISSHSKGTIPFMYHPHPGCAIPADPADGTFSVDPAPSLYADWADVASNTTLQCAAGFRPSLPASAICGTADYDDPSIHSATCVPGQSPHP